VFLKLGLALLTKTFVYNQLAGNLKSGRERPDEHAWNNGSGVMEEIRNKGGRTIWLDTRRLWG